MKLFVSTSILLLAAVSACAEARIEGALRKWQRVTLTFDGPETSEQAKVNPFRDYRLVVTFRHAASRKAYRVAGFFAADGKAAETGGDKGNKWRVHFLPDEAGEWTFIASFRTGPDVAVALEEDAGKAMAGFDLVQGAFQVGPADPKAPGFLSKGLLKMTEGRSRYPRFAETGEIFLKGGANSPENFLAYADFDDTKARHKYEPHVKDWKPGDPTWKQGKGKGIVGVVNYLASQGMNAQYFLTMNVQGDGDDIWPWISRDARDRYDCSKLDQWEIVFSHMDAMGILLHVVFNEQENDRLLNDGELGVERKLYYRELVARFGHHPALVWNLGEETTNTHKQHVAYLDYLRALDPHEHPITLHCSPGHHDRVYDPLLGNRKFTGPSLQLGDPQYAHSETIKWLDRSRLTGRTWWCCLDEIGPAKDGVVPDRVDPEHGSVRHLALWGNLMAGGGGVEWYFGWGHPNHDRALEDYRSRENMWKQTDIALRFFREYVPFERMTHNGGLVKSPDDTPAYCLADPGRTYAIYLPPEKIADPFKRRFGGAGGLTQAGGRMQIDLGSSQEKFSVAWFNPRTGGKPVSSEDLGGPGIRGPGWKDVGPPPEETHKDWVLLIRQVVPKVDSFAGRVVDATLINCETGRPIAGMDPIPANAKLRLKNLPKAFAFRANTEPAQVGSVQFTIDGKVMPAPDTTAPFAFPRDVNGRYTPWTPTRGAHTLIMAPYEYGAGTGKTGVPVQLQFEVEE